MSATNRVQLAGVRETTLGTTPTTPRMRGMRFTGESLRFAPSLVDSAEIRADRMNADPILVGNQSGGGINFELSFPPDKSLMSELLCSTFFADWVNTPFRDNDGTADSVITDVAASGGVVTVVTGAAFVAGQLVRNTGFGQAANNGIIKCTTGSATVPAFASQGLVNEPVPPAAARMKVVGFQGASGDITATASGLASTLLDFTTLGLAVGKWLKIGGTAAGDKFATAADNDWIRITAIAANAITADNLPTGWAVDAGAGKTIKVWTGDELKNGTTKIGVTLERGYLDQTTPSYIAQSGQVVNTMQSSIEAKRVITGSLDFLGMGGGVSTTPLDASIDASPDIGTYPVMAGSANVGRVAEAGAKLIGPNFIQKLTFSIANNLRTRDAADQINTVDIGEGDCSVTGEVTTYFGDTSLLTKYFNNTATSINARVAKGVQALIWQFPRVVYNSNGSPNAQAKNQDVLLPLGFRATLDSATGAEVILDRLEYFE
jgi:hypothetical protein